MPIRLSRILPLLFVLSFIPVANCLAGTPHQDSSVSAIASGNMYPDAPSFAAELQRIGNAIKEGKPAAAEMAALRRNLPSRWALITAERRYSVSAEPLRALLLPAERHKKPETRAAKATEAPDRPLHLPTQPNPYTPA